MKTSTDLSCIVRIDVAKSKSQHSWEVRIIRSAKSFRRSFSDAKYGGRKSALAAAIACRDAERKKRPALNSYEQAIRPRVTNRSGIVGVRRGAKVVSRGKKSWTYPCWIATGTPVSGGKTTTKYFSISQYGSSGAAKTAAIAQRRAWEKSLKASLARKQRSASS